MDGDIETFQNLIDSFFKSYVNETGCEGITNYICMLVTGHLKYYMEIHRNLTNIPNRVGSHLIQSLTGVLAQNYDY